jgi:acetylornithine deacetylase
MPDISPERILRELVAIDSVNPNLWPGASGEGGVAAWIERFCDEQRLAHELQPVTADRSNLLAWVPGRDDATLLFVAHMDTVPVNGWTRNPFAPEREGSRLYGRGSCDTKGSLAAMLHALATLKGERPRATVMVVGTVDEEHHKAGAKALAGLRKCEAAVIGEPTSLDVVVAHKGSVRWQIEVVGRSAHTSKPELGVNSITGMAKVVTAIDEAALELKRRVHPLVGTPTLTISLIEGGDHVCNVPQRCRITIDRRLIPGEAPKAALQEVEKVLQSVRKANPLIKAHSLPAIEDPAFESPNDARIVEIATAVCANIAGTGQPKGVPYGTDASQLASSMQCVVLGPGNIDQAHTTEEFIELPELERAAEIYRQIMLQY